MSESSISFERGLKPLLHRWVLWPTLSFLFVLAAGLGLKGSARVTGAEYRVDEILAAHRSTLLDVVANVLNLAFSDTLGPYVALAFFAAVWAGTKSVERTATTVLIVALGCVSCWIMKTLIGRQSPGDETLLISYPSGHTAFAVALASATYWLAQGTKRDGAALKAGVVLASAVGVSRLYLGVHYPTDAMAACILSLASAVFATGAAPLLLSTKIGRRASSEASARLKLLRDGSWRADD